MPLPAINRLPLRFERDRFTKDGHTFHTRHFTLVSAPSVIPSVVEESPSTNSSLRVSVPRTAAISLHQVPRFSILLSKKTARLAVNRNLIKRRTSALLAELISQFPPADYLVIPKRSVLDTPHSELLSDLSSLLPKLK